MRRVRHRLAIVLALALGATALIPGVRAQPDLGREAAQPTLSSSLEVALDDVAAEALWDVEELRSLLASEIAFEGYDGILKGARGALLSGTANATDQALLLGVLLERALIPYRFASCVLAIDGASGSAAAPDARVESAAMTTADDLAERAASLMSEIEDPEVRAALKEVVELWEAQQAETAAASAALAAELADVPLEVEAIAAPEEDLTHRHVWVQGAIGAEWRDLDTTTGDGSAPCEPSEIHETLPDGWAHHVTVAIEVEQRRGDRLETSDSFVYQAPTKDLASSRIAVTFGEPAGLVDDGSSPESAARARSPAGLKYYTPVILVDGLLGTGRPIELPPPSGASLGLGEAVGEVIEDLTDELFDGEAPSTHEEPVETDPYTAAWIRLELTAPDGRTQTFRSEIFDRIGILARMAGTAAEAEVWPLTDVEGEWAETSALWQVGILFGALSVPRIAVDDSLDVETASGVSGRLDALLRLYPTIHGALGGRPDGPVILVAGLSPVASDDGPATRFVLDALEVPTAPTPDRLTAAQDAQALLGAEALLTALLDGDAASTSDSVSVLRGEAPTGLVTIGPDDIGSLPAGLSPQARARMTERLGDGYWLMTPAAPAADGTAWWYVDPRTGLVRDEHESGRHSAAEDIIVRSQALSRTERIRRFACRVAMPAAIAASIIFTLAGSPEGPKLQRAVYNVATQTARREEQRKAAQAACSGTGVGPPL
ncbi:MAG TPA: hypothetical protein VJZ50_12065 [Candidatus Limnocylindrales bacterium]|nr:hypothetical protein [Candidatus Limnocylindrales bacterium]